MNNIKKALYFACEKHDGQYRKGGRIPYIAHPVLVVFGVQKYTSDEDVIATALLHDVLEDCPDVSIDILQKEFGDRITNLVKEVSFISDKKYATWKEKKEAYLEKIKDVSNDALVIIANDKITNFQAYFNLLQKGSEVVKKFHGTPEEYYWYYNEVANILKTRLIDHLIIKEYCELLDSYKK